MRMSDTRMPKQIFCGQLLQLAKMKQLQEVGTHKHYKDGLKQNLKACGIPPTELNNATAARGSWQTRIVLTRLTTSRPHVLAPSRPSDKLASQLPIIQNTAGQWACDRCDRVCELPDRSLRPQRRPSMKREIYRLRCVCAIYAASFLVINVLINVHVYVPILILLRLLRERRGGKN